MQASSGPVPALSISVVVHNSPLPALRETLSSLQCAVTEAVRGAVVQNVSLTLVDNASAPDYRVRLGLELKALQSQWADAALPLNYQPLDTNCGFGAGHNVALRAADAEFYLILNPDVVLHRDSLLLGLRRLADSRDIALLSPLATGPDGRREYLCKAYPSVWVLLLRGFVPDALRRRFDAALATYELREQCSGSREADVDIASGCCMLARREALAAVGGFDEGFFLYFEDFDLSLRLHQQGRLMFFPAMTIVHGGGYAARKGLRHLGCFVRSALRFFGRHGWRWV